MFELPSMLELGEFGSYIVLVWFLGTTLELPPSNLGTHQTLVVTSYKYKKGNTIGDY